MAMVVLTGEILLDAVGRNDLDSPKLSYTGTLGGSALNAASVLAKLGTPTRFVGEVGMDFLGQWARERITERRIETRYIQAVPGFFTPVALAEVNDSGEAQYRFYRVFGDTRFEPDKGALARAKWFHFGSLSSFEERNIPGITRLLDIAQEYDVMVSFDPNLRDEPSEAYVQQLLKYMPYISVFKASMEDAKCLFPESSNEPIRLLENLTELGAPLTVMTMGAEGAMATFRTRMMRVPGLKVSVVDTIGAGDTFTAGLIYGLLKQDLGTRIEFITWDGTQIPVILASSCHLAALACMVAGAGIPEKELQNWWERYG